MTIDGPYKKIKKPSLIATLAQGVRILASGPRNQRHHPQAHIPSPPRGLWILDPRLPADQRFKEARRLDDERKRLDADIAKLPHFWV